MEIEEKLNGILDNLNDVRNKVVMGEITGHEIIDKIDIVYNEVSKIVRHIKNNK